MKLGLGSWRFFLAFIVVISHLWSEATPGPAVYAVWGFYILSGFLMTHVLRFKYGQTRQGLKDYAYNRILRIYPGYVVAMLAGAGSLYFLHRMGVSLETLNPQFVKPANTREWINNILLIPVPTSGLLVPVSGALAVEVGAYLLMPLMAFSRAAAWLSLILSLLVNLKYGIRADTFGDRYSSFLTCFMVFSCGALLSQYRDRLERFRAPALSTIVWLVHCLAWYEFSLWPWTYGMYFSILLSAWLIISLASKKTGKLDTVLGDWSYPVYLFHTTIAVWLIPMNFKFKSFSFFLVAFLLTLLASWLVTVVIDKPLARLKKKKVEVKLA